MDANATISKKMGEKKRKKGLLLDGISYPASGIQEAENKTKPQTNFPQLFFFLSQF